jgi:hypothetical protein
MERHILRPLTLDKADNRADWCGAQRSFRRQCQLCDPIADIRVSQLERPKRVDLSHLGGVAAASSNDAFWLISDETGPPPERRLYPRMRK